MGPDGWKEMMELHQKWLDEQIMKACAMPASVLYNAPPCTNLSSSSMPNYYDIRAAVDAWERMLGLRTSKYALLLQEAANEFELRMMRVRTLRRRSVFNG